MTGRAQASFRSVKWFETNSGVAHFDRNSIIVLRRFARQMLKKIS